MTGETLPKSKPFITPFWGFFQNPVSIPYCKISCAAEAAEGFGDQSVLRFSQYTARTAELSWKSTHTHTKASSRRLQAQKVLGAYTRALGSTLSPHLRSHLKAK